jgi:hypothetical protein
MKLPERDTEDTEKTFWGVDWEVIHSRAFEFAETAG